MAFYHPENYSMKKILFAAACLGMIGSVQAQSMGDTKIYGVVDEYLDASNNGNSAQRLQSGGLSGSRIGFQGSEDLGSGLKAVYLLEAGIDADTGQSGQGGIFFGRQSYVGLNGNFGQVTLGRQYSTYFDTLMYGLGGGMAWGNANNYFNEGSMLRINNSIKYETPDMNGLVLKGLYGMGEKARDGLLSTGDVTSIGGQYDNGPVSVNLSYSARKSQHNNQEQWTSVGASYNFGNIKAGFLAIDVRDQLALNRNSTYEFSAEVPLPGASLLLDVGFFHNRALDQANATAYSARYDYFLSKRTTLYTGVALIRNDKNAAFTTNGATGAGMATSAGKNVRSLIAGIRHSF